MGGMRKDPFIPNFFQISVCDFSYSLNKLIGFAFEIYYDDSPDACHGHLSWNVPEKCQEPMVNHEVCY